MNPATTQNTAGAQSQNSDALNNVKHAVVTGALAEGAAQGALWLGYSVVSLPMLYTGVAAGTLVIAFEVAKYAIDFLAKILEAISPEIISNNVKKGLKFAGYNQWREYAVTALTIGGGAAAVFYLAPLVGISLTAAQVALLAGGTFAIRHLATEKVEGLFSN